jgi:hypothetical protein
MTTEHRGKADILTRLKTALTLELGTIPPYMMALLSIQKPRNRVAAELIRTVMIEEMLHMVLVGNVTSALGGTVTLNAESIPSYPLVMNFEGKRFKDRQFDVDLTPFSGSAIDTFMQIELPDDWIERPEMLKMAQDRLDISGMTIGDFYRDIIHRLEVLCRELGERAVFSGAPEHQIPEDFYWSSGGKPVKVTDMESARRALHVVIEQGEGSSVSIFDGDKRNFGEMAELAHFFRFREIHFGRRYQPGDRPHDPPSGEPFEVDYSAVVPFKANPRSSDYAPGSALANLNHRFNQQYTLMLIQIQEAFSGSPKTLYTAIMNGMHGLTSLAGQMMALPIPGDPEGRHGAPTFEWLDPWRQLERGGADTR